MSEGHRTSSSARDALLRALGRNIQQARHERGLTQAELAARIGVTAAYIGVIERGRRNLPFTTLLDLALALGVSPAQLFDLGDAAQLAAVTLAEVAPRLKPEATPTTPAVETPIPREGAKPSPIALRRWRTPGRKR